MTMSSFVEYIWHVHISLGPLILWHILSFRYPYCHSEAGTSVHLSGNICSPASIFPFAGRKISEQLTWEGVEKLLL